MPKCMNKAVLLIRTISQQPRTAVLPCPCCNCVDKCMDKTITRVCACLPSLAERTSPREGSHSGSTSSKSSPSSDSNTGSERTVVLVRAPRRGCTGPATLTGGEARSRARGGCGEPQTEQAGVAWAGGKGIDSSSRSESVSRPGSRKAKKSVIWCWRLVPDTDPRLRGPLPREDEAPRAVPRRGMMPDSNTQR